MGRRLGMICVFLYMLAATIAGSLAFPRSTTIAANANVGYVDFSFPSSIGTDPTAAKPQSKLWYNDGLWWAVMFSTPSNSWHIYKLNWPDQWQDTGTQVDERAYARADTMWDGSKLYIVSTLSYLNTGASNQGRLYRFSYNSGTSTYTLDPGFPVIVMSGSTETLTFDKDSTGQLWVSYTQSNKVYVNRSVNGDGVWGTPFVVPGARPLDPDDISSLVAYTDNQGPAIGVVWSNHTSPSSIYFSFHKDGDADTTWQPIETIYTGTCAADDHINLKSLQSDGSGTIVAAIKTSFGDKGCGGSTSSPLMRLVVRHPDDTWSWSTFGTVGDDHTRPIVLLDTSNRQVYMFATSPTSCGVIYYKKTSFDNPAFPSGKGTPFISSSTYTCINNATSTKQPVDASTGLVVMASDESKRFYLHNAITLGNPGPRLMFNTNPGGSGTSSVTMGQPFGVQPVVSVQKSPGKIDTTFNGPISLAIKSGTGTNGAVLSGVTTVQAVNGIATFNGLSINLAGNNYKLTASANTIPSTDSTAFNVVKRSQTITFGTLPNKHYGDAPFAITASATSGLAVSFSANGDCTINGAIITITNTGVCQIVASQAGDGTYDRATDVSQGFDILKGSQTITFRALPPRPVGEQIAPLNAYASSTSGLPISFNTSGDCYVANNALVLTGYDTCIIVASQRGNSQYNAAPDAFQMLSARSLIFVPIARRH